MFNEFGLVLNVLTTAACIVPVFLPLQVFAWKAHQEYKRRRGEWTRGKLAFEEASSKNPVPELRLSPDRPALVVRRRSGAEMAIGAMSLILAVPLAVANQWLLATSLPAIMPRGKVLLSLSARNIYATDLAALAIVLTEIGAGIAFLFGLEQFLEAQRLRRQPRKEGDAPEAFPIGMLLVTLAALAVGLIVIAAECQLAGERARLISGASTVLISGLIAGAVATGSFLFAALAVEFILGLVARYPSREKTGGAIEGSYHIFPPLVVPLWVAIGEHLWLLPFKHTYELDQHMVGRFVRRERGCSVTGRMASAKIGEGRND